MFKNIDQALQIGLVAEVHPPERLLPRAQVFVATLPAGLYILIDYCSPILITILLLLVSLIVSQYHNKFCILNWCSKRSR